MTYTTRYDHQKLAEAINLFADLDEVKNHPAILGEYQWRIDRWREGLYFLVVVGEVKKGKSSFINALLERDGLSPVGDMIASAVPIKIVHGVRSRYWVHFLPHENGGCPDPLEISAEELPKYATEESISTSPDETEAGKLSNRLAVDFVSIENSHRFLKEGLVVVDLPGLGGVFKHHARLVWEYLDPERADHIAFVFDSTSNPFAAEEKASIQAIKERNIDRFMFVQTKIDCADPEKIQAWKETNLKGLTSLLELPVAGIKYFLISNYLKQQWLATGREKDLKRSGFVELESYIANDLIVGKKDLLAEPVLLGLSTELDAIWQQLETQRKIYQEESIENSNKIFQAYQKKKQEFESWQRTVFIPLKSEFNSDLKTTRIDAVDRIQDELHPPKVTIPIYSLLDQSSKSENDVLQAQEEAKQSCIGLSLQRYQKIDEDYRVASEFIFAAAMEKLEATMPLPRIQQHEPNITGIDTINLPIKNRFMEYIQRGWSSVVLGGGIGSVVGPLGTVAGAIIGAWKAISETKQRNKEAALAKLKGVLDEAARQAQMQASKTMRKTCEQTESEYNKQLENAAKICYSRLNENLASAEQRVKDTEAEVTQLRGQLGDKLRKVNDIDRLLRASAGLN
jgi:GTP-binding protein EngB required for normal cell division